jgi:signal transduction histidine kinase
MAASVAVVVALGLAGEPWQEPGLVLVGAWCVFCAAANALPAPAISHISLSMGAPVNVAIAYLFEPGLAAAMVFVASVSEWEIKRETTLGHAVFNRLQLAAATALGSGLFHGLGGHEVGEVPALGLLVLAVVVYQSSNWLFVGAAEWTARAVPLRRSIGKLLPPNPLVAGTYLLLGFMGLVLALTSVRIGAWAVALVMLPLLGARHAVNVSRQLEQAERERRSLADRLIDERERERVRIASSIHDVVLQQLAALQLEADSIGAALEHQRPDVAVRLAGQLRSGVDDAIGELRGTIASLRRATMEDGGLGPSLERFARGFRASTGVEVAVDVAPSVGPDLPLPVGLLLFECCQEALTNVVRHAPSATRVEVGVERSGGTVELTVRDDGPGFAVPPSLGATGRSGLALSQEKVALSGGLLFVESRPGHGTTVTVRVPVGTVGA